MSFSSRELVFSADSLNKSATLPRISPDGRYLMFALAEYGVFHIWHHDADLWLLDLQTGEARAMQEINSPDTESYHAWSSNGKWVVFSSRRDDGTYTRPFFAHINKMIRAEVPFTVQLIDDYSFYNCANLEKLILRDGVKRIKGYAFSHINKLTSVDIPASVDSIRNDAFCYDPALQAINVSSANPKYCSVDGILFSKDKKRLVAFADGHGTIYTVPDGTQVVDYEAFRGATALTAVTAS